MRRYSAILHMICCVVLTLCGCSSSESKRETPAVTAKGSEPGKTPLSVVAWRSVRPHDGGPMAIGIDAAAGSIASEPRAGGVTQVEVEFSAPVKLASTDAVGAKAGELSIKPTSTALDKPNVLVMKFDGLKEGQCCLLSIKGAVEGITQKTECRVRCLQGDVNNDGKVDNQDALEIKKRVGQKVSADTARYDIDLKGPAIALRDALLAKSFAGHAANCP